MYIPKLVAQHLRQAALSQKHIYLLRFATSRNCIAKDSRSDLFVSIVGGHIQVLQARGS